MKKIRFYQSIYNLYIKQPSAKNVYQQIAKKKQISSSHVKNIVRVMKFEKTQQLLINKKLDLGRCLILLAIKQQPTFDEFASIAQTSISRTELTQLIKNSQQPDFYILDNGQQFTKKEVEKLSQYLSELLQTPVTVVIGQSSETLTLIVHYYLLSWALDFLNKLALSEHRCKVQLLNSVVSSQCYDKEYRREGQVHIVFTTTNDFNRFYNQLSCNEESNLS